MGRLSNPPETLKSASDQGGHDSHPPGRTTSKDAKRSSNASESGDLEEKGQLSNPVQRRLSEADVDALTHLYEDGASIDVLGRRYRVHRTTVIRHLDHQGVARRGVVRKVTDSLVSRASKRYAEGLSLAEIAEAALASHSTVAAPSLPSAESRTLQVCLPMRVG